MLTKILPGLVALALIAVAGCSDPSTGTNDNGNNTSPICGNGQQEGMEQCDGADLGGETCGSLGMPDGLLQCFGDCTFHTSACVTASCPNGVAEPGEDCDTDDLDGQTCESLGYATGTLACLGHCQFDESQCETVPVCGDAAVDVGELCDGANLDGQTCESRGYASGFLTCSTTCQFDETQCVPEPDCGNGVLNGTEQCDGSNLNSQTCALQGFDGGTLGCTGGCLFDTIGCFSCGDGVRNGAEECDNQDLGTTTCALLTPYPEGALACLADCTIDAAGCYLCGNGTLEGPEVCDGANLDGETCASITGHLDGLLSCSEDCSAVQVSGCHTLGNGAVEGPEICDGTNLDGETCATQAGHAAGILTCNAAGTGFDTSDCHTCGDGIVQGSELCDGMDLAGAECDSIGLGYTGGILGCDVGCGLYDLSSCATCGNGVVEPTELCEDGNTYSWDGCDQCAVGPFLVNTSVAGDQRWPDVATSDDGVIVVVWSGPTTDGLATAVWGQRFDDQGQRLGGEFTVGIWSGNQQVSPAVASTATGGFVVGWSSDDGSDDGIWTRRYDDQGQPLGASLPVNTFTTGDQKDPSIAVNDDGSFVVVWISGWSQDGEGWGVFGQRFDATGSAAGAEFQVNTYWQGAQTVPEVSAAPDGSFVVVWSHIENDADAGIRGQRFSATGQPLGAEIGIFSSPMTYSNMPRVSVADSGSFVVVWQDSWSELRMRRYDAAGSALAPSFVAWTPSLPSSIVQISVAHAANGDHMVAWNNQGLAYRRWYLANGTSLGSQLLTWAGSIPTSYFASAVVPDKRHAFVWTRSGVDGDGWGVIGQRCSSLGTPLGVMSW